MISASLEALLGAALVALAARRIGAEDRADRLHGARDRPAQGLRGRLQQGEPEHRDQVGARLDRRHHRQAARREGQPAGRRRDGRGRVEPGAARHEGMLDAVRAAQPRRDHGRSTATRRTRRRGVGMDVWGATVCFNTVEAQKKDIPKPETWKDLTKPVYKGQIVMPNPASSGTGYFDVTAWLQMLGERRQGRRLEVHGRAAREHRAVHALGLASPCNMAAAGEFSIGISFEYRANSQQGQGRADRPGVPEGRPGLGPRGLRDPQGHEEARRGARSSPTGRRARTRWSCTPRTSRSRRSPAWPQPLPNVPADYEKRLVKNDFAWAAKNRDQILAEWNKRYDAKSEPKK